MGRRAHVVFRIFAVLLGSFQLARADGAFVWHKGADLYEPSQKAIILHKDGVQDMILQVKYSGPAKDFCWLIPVPATPELQAIDQDAFAELSLYTQERMRWGHKQAESRPVEEISHKKVGVFDTAVVKATGAADIQQWLAKHGFVFPADREEVLGFYLRKGWVFTAVRIDPAELTEDVEKKLHQGTLQPLRLTFSTKEIVYPLYISSINGGQTQLLLFVLSDGPVFHPWCITDNAPKWAATDTTPSETTKSFTESWHGRTYYRRITSDELPTCRKVLKRMKDDRWFLTRLDGLFTPEMMVDDLTIKPDDQADSSKAVTAFVTRERIIYGVKAATRGNYQDLADPDREIAAAWARANNDVHGHVESRQGMTALFKEMEADPIPTGWDRDKLHLRPAWLERLDEHERECLLKSALVLHRQLIVQISSSSDPDRATVHYRQIDKAAMEACCLALGESVPEYRNWESYQRQWLAIEEQLGRSAGRDLGNNAGGQGKR